MITFTERLPDTKSATHRGYTFARCGSNCGDGCDAKIVYDARGKGKKREYAVTEFPCDFAGRSFRVERSTGESYDVFISERSPREDICDCLAACNGRSSNGCVHREILRDVLANKLLPSPLCNEDADSYSMELAE